MVRILIGIIIVLGIIFAIFLINIKESSEFSKNYKDVPRKNVYKKVDAKELVNIIENKTGIIYLGFPTCPWCKQLVPLLDKAAKYNNVQNVYYVDNFYNSSRILFDKDMNYISNGISGMEANSRYFQE